MPIYWKKERFYILRENSESTPTGLAWDANTAAISLFCNTNIHGHFHIDHNAPCLPHILRNHCFQFLLGITVVPREFEKAIAVQNLRGGGGGGAGGRISKVHHGLCENGEWQT